MKRIDFIAPPFSGHLNPIIGMARSLAHEYEVRVISTKRAQPRIKAAGLRAVELVGNYDESLEPIVNPAYAVGHNILKLHRQFKHVLVLFSALRKDLKSLYRADRPDLMIVDFTLPVAGKLAEELGLAWWTSHPSPCTIETGDGPPAYLGGLSPANSWLGGRRDALGRLAVRSFKRLLFHLYKSRIRPLGFGRIYREDRSEELYSAECILGLGLAELEFATRWPAAMRFIGPVLYTPPTSEKAPVFCAQKTYVLITTGTHLKWYKDRFAKHIKAIAARMPDLEFHVSDGSTDATRHEAVSNFARFPFISYERHVKRYHLVIHHGGANIMYYCLQHGIPAIIHPLDYDQFDHAARLKVSGTALVARKPDEIESRIKQALKTVTLRQNAQRFSLILNEQSERQPLKRLVQKKFAQF